MIAEILYPINEHLQNVFGGQFFGLAQGITRKQGTETDTLPGIVGKDGEITFVGVDDVDQIRGYHKLGGVSTTQLRNGKGDRIGDVQNVFQLSLFLLWDTRKLPRSTDEMLLLLQANFPTSAIVPDVKITVLRLTGANLNSYQIFQQEYKYNDLRPLPENIQLIQFNYLIDTIINPDCIKACP